MVIMAYYFQYFKLSYLVYSFCSSIGVRSIIRVKHTIRRNTKKKQPINLSNSCVANLFDGQRQFVVQQR